MKREVIVASLALMFANNASAITLKEGLDIVFEDNPALQTVKNELKVKEQQKLQARSGFLPEVDLFYSIDREHYDLKGAPKVKSSPSDGGVVVSQSIYAGGRTLASFKASKFNEQAALNNYKLAQQQSFRDAADAYLTVLTAQKVYEFNIRQVATNTEEMKRIKQRFELGDITLPNLKEFEARLSGYIADKEESYGDLLSAKAQFLAVYGQSADGLVWPSINPNLPAQLDEALEVAKVNNPDILQLKLLLEASNQNIDIARAGFMPTLDAVASYTKNKNRFSGSGTQDSDIGTIGLQASLPLYRGGNTLATFKQAKLQKLQASDNLRDKIRAVEESTANSYNDVQVQLQRVKALRLRLKSFQITTDATEKQEAAGEASIIDVLDARDDEFAADVDLQLAKQNLDLAKLELLSALGKFTYADLDNVFVEQSVASARAEEPKEKTISDEEMSDGMQKEDEKTIIIKK